MRYQQSLDVHERIEEVLRLIKTGRYSTPALAEEIGVSIPTISRIVAVLRERGHDIQSERTKKGWRYVLVSIKTSESPGTLKTSARRMADASKLRGNAERSNVPR